MKLSGLLWQQQFPQRRLLQKTDQGEKVHGSDLPASPYSKGVSFYSKFLFRVQKWQHSAVLHPAKSSKWLGIKEFCSTLEPSIPRL